MRRSNSHVMTRRSRSNLITLARCTPQKIPDGTIDQYRVGLHREVAGIIDPNHDCIRRIVVELIQLAGQAGRILHSPQDQRWHIDPK